MRRGEGGPWVTRPQQGRKELSSTPISTDTARGIQSWRTDPSDIGTTASIPASVSLLHATGHLTPRGVHPGWDPSVPGGMEGEALRGDSQSCMCRLGAGT